MFQIILFGFTVFLFAGCSSQQVPVKCGALPKSMYSCLGNPKIVNVEVAKLCGKPVSECERVKCIFQKSGWIKPYQAEVDKQKLADYYDQFAKNNTQWQQAVQYVKSTCLGQDLPAQGVYTNCPAYDIAHCSLTGFLRNAQPSQWGSSFECQYAKQYAAFCPICPEDCFATAIPVGSCNACRVLPTTP